MVFPEYKTFWAAVKRILEKKILKTDKMIKLQFLGKFQAEISNAKILIMMYKRLYFWLF